jgi:N-acetylmuramoyl-L-alanine amidase
MLPAFDRIVDSPPRVALSIDQRLPAALLPDLRRVPGPPRMLLSTAVTQTRPPIPASTPRTTEQSTRRPTTDTSPAQATSNGVGDRSLTRVLGLKLGRVVIDPGHGGHDVGTSGPSGFYEKDLVLDVSLRLGALIERRLNSEVVYTRSDDTFIPLRERTEIANEHRADLFLSIHANSSSASAASGIETYYLNFTTSKSALDVAARENAGSDRSIYDLKDLVQQITLKEKVEESREFAGKVQNSMMTLARKSNDRSRDRGVRKAPFVVLIGASMPSVLVEIGFLSNPKDEALMKKPEYRQRIAEALYKGVSQYANSLSHFQVAQQRKAE